MTEKTVQRRIKWITIGAVVLLFALIILLVFQYSGYWKLKNKEKILHAKLQDLIQMRENCENEADYKLSEKFIEEYAREVLGWGKDGEIYYKK